VAGAAGLAAYAAATADRGGLPLALIGVVGVVVLGVALSLRLAVLVAPALGLLGAEYAALFALRGDAVDSRAPLYGACFLAVAELAYGALELRAGTPEPGLTARRIVILAGLALASVIVGTIVLAAASAPLDGGVGLEAVGVVAAVALLVALGRMAVRSR
jgi:hypothetical protein